MKSVCLIFLCLIALPAVDTFAARLDLVPLLAQDDNSSNNAPTGSEPVDEGMTAQRGTSSPTSSSKITPVTQSYNVQGIIMLFLMAAALFPLCKSSARGR
jgi:hypothetical protein